MLIPSAAHLPGAAFDDRADARLRRGGWWCVALGIVGLTAALLAMLEDAAIARHLRAHPPSFATSDDDLPRFFVAALTGELVRDAMFAAASVALMFVGASLRAGRVPSLASARRWSGWALGVLFLGFLIRVVTVVPVVEAMRFSDASLPFDCDDAAAWLVLGGIGILPAGALFPVLLRRWAGRLALETA